MADLSAISAALSYIPPVGPALAATLLLLWLANRFLERRLRVGEGQRFQKQIILLGIAVVGLLAIILTLPVSAELRGQLLSFLGIVLSAAIALSSTTLLGNVLAGVMLRTIQGFRMGDFIRVGDHFGRVSERGLFHTEIQTADRDLTTLPNLYLVTNPVTTIRSSGTIVAATLSLGYDVPRTKVEELLIAAAEECTLEEPFLHVVELGDFSVTYRIAGLLTDVSRLISVRSRLRALAMDALHRGGIEIVSPAFMNQRVYPMTRHFIPKAARSRDQAEPSASPEATVFDKAEDAEEGEQMLFQHKRLAQEIEGLRAELKHAETPAQKTRLQRTIDRKKEEQEQLVDEIERRKDAQTDDSRTD